VKTVIAILLGVVSPFVIQTGATDERLDAVRSQYIQSVTAIHSAKCKGTIYREPHHDRVEPGDEPILSIDFEQAWDGDLRLLRTRYKSRSEFRNEVLLFDGKDYHQYNVTLNPQLEVTSPEMVSITKDPPIGWRSLHTIEHFMGRDLWGSEMDLTEAVLLPQVRLLDDEEVEGHACLHLDLGAIALQAKAPNRTVDIQAWLDPAHGSLPRRILLERTSNEGRASRTEMLVEEFGEAVTGGAVIHYPRRATNRNAVATFRLEVASVELNQTLPPDTFHLEYKDGTVVTNRTGAKPATTYIGGVIPARFQPKPLSQTKSMDDHSAEQRSARPSDHSAASWVNFLPWLSASALAALAALWWYRART
jgi:hypothetical protein